MDEKVLASLIQILQKQANYIRTLKLMHVALSDVVRKVAERSGLEYEEFEKLVNESLSDAQKSEPQHRREDIAREIEETIDELNLLERQTKEPSN